MFKNLQRIRRRVSQKLLAIFGEKQTSSKLPGPVQIFSYKPPARDEARKQIVRLSRSENLRASIQVLGSGFRENLHSHSDIDYVLRVCGAEDSRLSVFQSV